MKSFIYEGTVFEIADPATLTFENDYFRIIYETLYNHFSGNTLLPHINFDNFIDNNFPTKPAELAQKNNIKLDTNPALPSKPLYPFFVMYPVFSGIFQNITLSAEIAIKHAEFILKKDATLKNFIEVKRVVDAWNDQRWTRLRDKSESQSGVSTLGTISEKLLETALNRLIDNNNFFKNTKAEIQSYGDFVLMTLPNNLWVSVKSNFARERLLASGYSTDIIGAGFFTSYKEFTNPSRIRNFQKVGFLAMYLPDIPINDDQANQKTSTYDLAINHLTTLSLPLPLNINGKPFLRKLTDIPNDLATLLSEKNIKKRTTIGF